MRRFVDPQRKHHFFKILLEENVTRMRIPEAFYPRLSRESQSAERAVVQGPSGAFWVTRVSKSQGGIYLEKGWEVFVRENGLQVKDFLVFRYDGCMQFSVKVFNMHGVPREECFTPVRASLLPEETDESNEDESDEEESNEYESDEDEDDSNEDESEAEYVPRENGRKRQYASRFNSPFFNITVRRAYLEHNYLPIPWAVKRKYFHKNLKRVTIITADASEDRAWRIRTLHLATDDVRLSKGINDFLKKKNGLNLKIGDVCHFEVVKKRPHKLVLRVEVSRNSS
ncbi:hypothetical protein MKX01_023430 [Papaver californicum]|nr:hypothetical protein MKX01_023430 [Papaver californicum]